MVTPVYPTPPVGFAAAAHTSFAGQVTAVATTPTQFLNGDGNRVRVYAVLHGVANDTTEGVAIAVKRGAVYQRLGMVQAGQPGLILRIEDFGNLIQEELFYVNLGAERPLHYGYVTQARPVE